MDDLISREAAIEAIDAKCKRYFNSIGIFDYDYDKADEQSKWISDGAAMAVDAILDLPSAERVGKWMAQERGIHTTKYRCSECGRVVWDDTGYDVCTDYPYCNCGARMKGDGDE